MLADEKISFLCRPNATGHRNPTLVTKIIIGKAMSSIFLSHNSKDKPWVRDFANRLINDGVVVWLDEAELNIGDSLIDRISSAINEMKYIAAVISPNSVLSSWVQKELSLAMSKEIKGRQVTVLPLLIQQCEIPASIQDKLYADFTDPSRFEVEYDKVLRAIGIQRAKSAAKEASVNNVLSVVSTKSQSEQSQELRIVGVVKSKTRQDREFSGLQDYFFQLSEVPPSGWDKYFLEARRFPRHNMWRNAWVEADCVVIKCALDEIGRYHLRDLKTDVATANENFARAKQEAQLRSLREQQRIEKEKRERDDTLDALDFD